MAVGRNDTQPLISAEHLVDLGKNLHPLLLLDRPDEILADGSEEQVRLRIETQRAFGQDSGGLGTRKYRYGLGERRREDRRHDVGPLLDHHVMVFGGKQTVAMQIELNQTARHELRTDGRHQIQDGIERHYERTGRHPPALREIDTGNIIRIRPCSGYFQIKPRRLTAPLVGHFFKVVRRIAADQFGRYLRFLHLSVVIVTSRKGDQGSAHDKHGRNFVQEIFHKRD